MPLGHWCMMKHCIYCIGVYITVYIYTYIHVSSSRIVVHEMTDLDRYESAPQRWSRFLDTTDVKGVKAQGEFWQREAVKTVRILAKMAPKF